MRFVYLRGVALFTLIHATLSLRTLNDVVAFNCTQEVPCKAEFNKCFYKGWLMASDFTPSEPDELQVHVDVRRNVLGDLEPVIVAEWKAKDDGSISHLNGTELRVMKLATQEFFCVHFTFLQSFKTMRNLAGEKWSFYLDKVVVDPGSTYVINVSNLPKPNIDHSSYNVQTKVEVPGCYHPLMKKTQICVERGETWQPNITVLRMEEINGKDALRVSFTSGENVLKYNIFMKCNGDSDMKTLYNERQTLLHVSFDLDNWSRSCCKFDVQIQPFLKKCTNDCLRWNRSFVICGPVPTSTPDCNASIWVLCIGFCLIFGIGFFCICYRSRKQPRGKEMPLKKTPLETEVPDVQRSVLIIYSRDHPLYTEIVLKLCAFLRAKCGTDVVLDLLDTTWLGTIGRMQWIEQKKRYIEQSSNKILILCSQGVQAKWGAICGEPRVLLHEDVRSPVGDMLTLALQLITPDMQRPASYGKYLVAYFDDVSSERDVPSLFDIAVKYRLMKHFEELYFRILDVEKYQQGMERCIKDIGKDEYFSCPSGEALKTAIEAFQLHQIKNPDWFEKECLSSEDEVRGETDPLFMVPSAPIYQKKPIINTGPPILKKDIKVSPQTHSICTVTPEIHKNPEELSMIVVNHRVHSDLSEVLPYYSEMQCPVDIPNVASVNPHLLPCLQEELMPAEASYSFELPMGDPSDLYQTDNRNDLTAPPPSMEDSLVDQEMVLSTPVEMEESEMDRISETRPSRGSDQGYGSRYSTDREEYKLQQDLSSLRKLQLLLLLNSPISSGFFNQTMEK